MKINDPTAGIRVAQIAKQRLNPSAFIDIGQWIKIELHKAGQIIDVFFRLPVHPTQRRPDGLGLNDSDRLAIDNEQVVGLPLF